MLSVLAFKRFLSAGILDGGNGEILLGGSRLTRFMKDVENVTGRMGEAEPVAPAEEARNVASNDDVAGPVDDAEEAAAGNAGEIAAGGPNGAGASSRDVDPNP